MNLLIINKTYKGLQITRSYYLITVKFVSWHCRGI